MTVLFLLFMRDDVNEVSLLFGLLASLPLYIGFSYVLAKFGYTRKTLAEMRTPRATTSTQSSSSTSSSGTSSVGATNATNRQRPAPTRRTAGSSNRPGQRPASRKRR